MVRDKPVLILDRMCLFVDTEEGYPQFGVEFRGRHEQDKLSTK
jgi:hypothetical protein